MILIGPETARHYAECGLWGKVTLDGLLARTASKRPEETALVVPRPGDNPGGLQASTWTQIDSRVSALSAALLDAGLKQDEIIGIQLANGAEHIIACLGALRAGLIPALFPVLWRRRELAAACRQVAPAALISAGRIGPTAHGELTCHLAAEIPTVRRVFAFGDDLPDGVQGLNGVLTDTASTEGAAGLPRVGNPADHVAMITFGDGPDGSHSLARSHNQWLSAAMMVVLTARIGSGAHLLATVQPTSLGGLAAGMVAWLLAGCRLHPCPPADCADLAEAIAAADATHCCVPGSLASQLLPGGAPPGARLIRLWRDPLTMTETVSRPATDVISLGEMALWAETDIDGPTIPLAGRPAASEADPRARLLTSRIAGRLHRAGNIEPTGALLRGRLAVGGPQTPAALPPNSGSEDDARLFPGEYVDTGLECRLVEARPARARLTGTSFQSFRHGGVSVPARALDALYRSAPGVRDAAVIAVPHPVLGHVFHAAIVPENGEACSIGSFEDYLHTMDAAPYMWPERIVPVAAIPRGADGAVLRHLIEPRTAA